MTRSSEIVAAVLLFVLLASAVAAPNLARAADDSPQIDEQTLAQFVNNPAVPPKQAGYRSQGDFRAGKVVVGDEPEVGANYNQALFNHALIKGKFVNCSFIGARFSYADVRNAEFINCDFTGAKIDHVKGLRIKATELLRTRSFEDGALDLCGSEITIYNDLTSRYRQCVPVILKNADLSGSKIRYVQLDEIDGKLQEKELPLEIVNCNVDDSTIPINGSNIKETTGYAKKRFRGNTISFAGDDFDCSRFVFYNCRIQDVDLEHDKFDEAYFIDCVFENVEKFSFKPIMRFQNWIESDENMNAMKLVKFSEEYQVFVDVELDKETEFRNKWIQAALQARRESGENEPVWSRTDCFDFCNERSRQVMTEALERIESQRNEQ